MKLTKKVPVSVQNVDDKWIVKSEDLFAAFASDPQIEGVLELTAEYNGKVLAEKVQHEEIMSILNKLEKYQSGKMSDKEAGKMVNKLKNFSNMDSIINKFQKNEKLSTEDVKALENMSSSTIFKMDYNALKLVESDLMVQEVNLVNLFPVEEFQTELKEKFEEQEAEYKREQKAKIMEIMGTKDEGKSRKTVVQYLQEKQAQIAAGATVEFMPDIQFPLPQANDLGRVLDWGQDLANSGSDKLDLEMLENDLDKRDVHYYSRALCYLGLVYVDDRYLCLTRAGDSFFTLNREAQKMAILEILMRDELIAKYIEFKTLDDDMKKEFNMRGLSGSTIDRRLSSLDAWIKYLVV